MKTTYFLEEKENAKRSLLQELLMFPDFGS